MGRSPLRVNALAAFCGLVITLLLAAAAPTVQVAAAAPAIGGFSARALDATGNATSQTYFTVTLPAGGSFNGKMLVSNAGSKPIRLHVYPVNGLTGTTTGAVYANRIDSRKGDAGWVTPIVGTLHLDAAKSASDPAQKILSFKVEVPPNAIPGDHLAALAFENADRNTSKGKFAITEIIRVAVAIQITVTGPAKKALKVTNLGVKPLSGTQVPSIIVGLSNVGRLLCKPFLTVALDPNGKPIGTVKRQLDTVLPRDSVQYPLPWPNPLPAGVYHVAATTTECGPSSQQQATLTLKSGLTGSPTSPGPNAATTAKSSGGGVPIWALVLTAIVAVIGTFFLARRKPREKKPADDDIREA